MNEAEQTRRLRSMNERELVKLQKRLAGNIADIKHSIADTDAYSVREPMWKNDNDALNNKRRARLMTRTRRLQQVERRLVDVRAGAPLTDEPAVVDKVAQGIWRRLAAQHREFTQYLTVAQRHGNERQVASFTKSLEKINEQMRAIAEGGN